MIGVLVLTLLAFLLSLILVSVEQKLSRKDKKQKQFLNLLPGYNCGTCGFGSCEGMSFAMLDNIDNYKKCKLLNGDALKQIEDYVKKIK